MNIGLVLTEPGGVGVATGGLLHPPPCLFQHRRNLVVLFACKVSLLHLLIDNLPGVIRAPVVDEEYLA